MSTRPFPADLFAGQRFAVLGLGRAGLPASRALVAMGAEVTVWDDKPAAREAATGLTVAEPVLAGLTALVLSPGIPHLLPKAHPIAASARAMGIPILSDADLLYRAVRGAGSSARFVGITGTNGKSTTTALLAHILGSAGIDNAAGGNLGDAALSLPLFGDGGVYVLEMSSYMLERLATLRFDAAAMLNLSADHIDRHGDMAGYAMAKRHIFDRQTEADTAVIGRDDALSRAVAAEHGPARLVTISEDDIPIAAAPTLPGRHNAQNIAAATALARALGLDDAAIAAGIRSYPGLPHRQELVATTNGVAWINDSKATNADSAARALACYDRIVWIAGGMGKEGGIAPLAEFFPRIQHTFLIGRDAPIFAETLTAHGVPFTHAGTLERAVAEAARLLPTLSPAPQAVLLSPATASWDQFTGFDQRGDHFRVFAQAIAAGGA
jgi:UDP-N-acetylmuramoylalanine--D-glutamate ligase